MLEPLYWAISWILLQWHALWHLVFRGGQVLATNWEWVLAIVFLVLTIRTVLFPVFDQMIPAAMAPPTRTTATIQGRAFCQPGRCLISGWKTDSMSALMLTAE